MQDKVVLITGAAKRVGAVTATALHAAGAKVAIHYHRSAEAAEALAETFNQQRAESAIAIGADLADTAGLPALVEKVVSTFGQLDVLINNASSFYPTPVGEITEQHWQDLFNTNAKAPLFLAQAAAEHLKKQQGCIVNMVDVHAKRPLQQHSVYCMAKAALAMMTMSLARDLAPEIRVNGVAPGMIMWPDEGMPEKVQTSILNRVALKRAGSPENIAQTILFILQNDYLTGQIIAVDGGRLLAI
ncbi:MAG: pteridine reductase [Legionellaceae bacterium]|nr:pteridine reductase [Legionellaceae bacterium]